MTLKHSVVAGALVFAVSTMGTFGVSAASPQLGGLFQKILENETKQEGSNTREQRGITSADQVVRPQRLSTGYRRLIPGTQAPATSQMGANIKLDMRTADSLEKSLAAMNGPLSQDESMHFMYALFVMASVEYCLWTGDANIEYQPSGHLSSNKCLKARTSSVYGGFTEKARAYISDGRLDEEKEYIVTNGFGNTRRVGHSRRQSYVNYVEFYAPMLDGYTRPEIEAFYYSYYQR